MGPWRADFVHPQTIIASSSRVSVSLLAIVNILVQTTFSKLEGRWLGWPIINCCSRNFKIVRTVLLMTSIYTQFFYGPH